MQVILYLSEPTVPWENFCVLFLFHFCLYVIYKILSDFLPIKKCRLTEIVKMNHLTWVKQFFSFGLPKTAFRLCFVHINLMYTKLFDYVRFLNVHLKQPKFMWIIISTRWQWNVFYPKQFASTVSDCRDTKAAARPFIGDVSQTLPEPLGSAGVGIYYIYFRPTSVYFPHVGTSRLIHLFVLSCHICSLILVKKGLLGKFVFWFLASECACKCISFNKNLKYFVADYWERNIPVFEVGSGS